MRQPLTSQQRLVLRMVAEGATTDEIASTLGITRGTVQTHMAGALNRLEVHTRAAAVAVALRTGQLDREPCIEFHEAVGAKNKSVCGLAGSSPASSESWSVGQGPRV